MRVRAGRPTRKTVHRGRFGSERAAEFPGRAFARGAQSGVRQARAGVRSAGPDAADLVPNIGAGELGRRRPSRRNWRRPCWWRRRLVTRRNAWQTAGRGDEVQWCDESGEGAVRGRSV